jgi:hypothetical protein
MGIKKNIITDFSSGTPSSTYSVATGYTVGSEWINTNNGNRFYHKTDGNWVLLTSESVSSPFYIEGGSTYSFDTTSKIYRTGSLNIGTGTTSSSRFVVSSTSGTVSLVVDNNGNVYNNSKGLNNTLFGYQAGSLTTGGFNTAFGKDSLLVNSTGAFNTAFGMESLWANTTGQNNTAVGFEAFYFNGTGSNNTVLGYAAGTFTTPGSNNTKSDKSVFIGVQSRPQNINETNQIVIGYEAYGNGSNTVTLGSDLILATILKGKVGIGVTGPSTNLHVWATQSGAFRLEDGTQAPGYVLTSDTNGVGTWTSSLAGLSLLGNSEVISTAVIATASVVVYDYSLSSLWYHGTASSDFTANFINLPTTDNRVLSASVVINQGLNGYIPNIVQIEGVTQSVKWPGGTQSGTSYNLDIVTFNFIRTSETWTNVIGQVASFT